MNEEQMNALREWVLSEINYERASNEEGSDGYRHSAINEREEAKARFQALKKLIVI